MFAVHGKKGDVIIIPAGYGHVTINPSTSPLKTANWIAENDKGDFSMFEKNQGACYYYLAPDVLVKNERVEKFVHSPN